MARTALRSTNRPRDPLGRIESDASTRVVDLKLVFVRDTTGEVMLDVGGRWDSVDAEYLAAAPRRCKIVRLNEAQVESALGLKEWVAARRERRNRVVEMVLEGGRGSGKSVLGVLAVFAIAIAFPDARCFLISTANTRRGELERIVRDHIPRSWRAWDAKSYTYALPNGSTVQYLGADDEDALRQGGYEVALANELQLFTSSAYSTIAAGIRNVSMRPRGLLVCAMNPATKVKGEWTEDHLDKIDGGKLNALHFVLDPKLNQFVEDGAVDDIDGLIRSARPDLADADAQGIRRRLGDMAAPAFRPLPVERGGHIGLPPRIGWRNVTRERTAGRIGRFISRRDGYDVVIGADFQKRPGCCATVFRMFDRGDGKVVYFAEKFIGADDNEDDLARRIEEYLQSVGLTIGDALIVGDSTGSFQNNKRDGGKKSHQIMREWGYDLVAPEDAKDPNCPTGVGQNPNVEDCLAQFYDVCEASRLLVAPSEEWLATSLQRCKVRKRGYSLRLVDDRFGYSHPVDTCRYVVWRFEPRRGPAVKPVTREGMRRSIAPRRM